MRITITIMIMMSKKGNECQHLLTGRVEAKLWCIWTFSKDLIDNINVGNNCINITMRALRWMIMKHEPGWDGDDGDDDEEEEEEKEEEKEDKGDKTNLAVAGCCRGLLAVGTWEPG